MDEALRFFHAFEVWIYLLLGLGAVVYIRKFILAWQELREAAFGLEREIAQSRLNQSASVLVLLLAMAVTEFVLASFVAPAVPGAIPQLTPTLDLLATPTFTLSPGETPQPLETGQPVGAPTAAGGGQAAQTGCLPGQVEILSPKNGEEVSGVVPITGTVNIPDFGFYLFQMKRPEDPENTWAILQAGNEIKNNSKLGDWDTRRLTPGEYQLGLQVKDNQDRILPLCIIQLSVVPSTLETPSP
jgi:hypothetical protein